jgi:hypothetical protein
MDNDRIKTATVVSYVGKMCYWTDKVTSSKKYDGAKLGVCVGETKTREGITICWFKKPFHNFCWHEKSNLRLEKHL